MINKPSKERLLIKYQNRYPTTKGGIFDKRARARLLDQTRPYGGRYPGNTQANFWNRITSYVCNALVDLELFMEASPNEKVNEVVYLKSIKPLVETYLQIKFGGELANLDINKVEIANYMIQAGFEYLSKKSMVADYEEPIIKNALELSDRLASRLELEILKEKEVKE